MNTKGGFDMYKCYSDVYGNMPCDNGCLCDRCEHMKVEIIDNSNRFTESEEDEVALFNGDDDRKGNLVHVLDKIGTTYCIRFLDGTEVGANERDIVFLDKEIDSLTREEMIGESVRLVGIVNSYSSGEENRRFFSMLSDSELREYLTDVYREGYPTMTEEERERAWDTLAEQETYCPSVTGGDYSPSCPWNAPGMSVKDFI